MLHVEEEALALLLAVVADIDPGGDLLGHHPAQRLPAGRGELRRVDRLALRAAHVQPDQLGRPRQAAGVGGQDPLLAPPHGSVSGRFLYRFRRTHQRYPCGAGRGGKLAVESCQRCTKSSGELKISGVINRESVRSSQSEKRFAV